MKRRHDTNLEPSSATEALPEPERFEHAPVAFSIWVRDDAFKSGHRPVVAHAPVPAHVDRMPWFYKKDTISGRQS